MNNIDNKNTDTSQANKRPTITQNQISPNSFLYVPEVKVLKPSSITFMPVDKIRFDKVKRKTEDTLDLLSKGSLKKEIYLGLSTTFLGSFIGWIPDLYRMVTSADYDFSLVFYSLTVVLAIGFFFAFLNIKHDSDATPLLKEIQSEIEAMSNAVCADDNHIPNNAIENINDYKKNT